MNSRQSEPRRQPRGDIEINSRLCKGCGYCVDCYPQKALAISSEINERGYNYAYYLGDGCTGCGLCFYNCPEPGAVIVYKRPKETILRGASVAQ